MMFPLALFPSVELDERHTLTIPAHVNVDEVWFLKARVFHCLVAFWFCVVGENELRTLAWWTPPSCPTRCRREWKYISTTRNSCFGPDMSRDIFTTSFGQAIHFLFDLGMILCGLRCGNNLNLRFILPVLLESLSLEPVAKCQRTRLIQGSITREWPS